MDARTLALPISKLNPQEPCCVERGTLVSEVIYLMQEGRFGCVLVVDEQGNLVGIITERDLLTKILGKSVNIADIVVDDIMSTSPESLHLDDPIAFALNLMHFGGFRHIPLLVSDDDASSSPAGIVSSKDIVNHVANYLEAKLEAALPDGVEEAS